VLENRVFGRIFGPNRDEGKGGWKELYIEELHTLYSSSNITRLIKSRMMMLARHIACMGEINCVRNFGFLKARERPLEKPGHRQKDNIKLDLREQFGEMDWIHLPWDRDQYQADVNLWLP
jgi:hypothetical protein